MKTRNSFFKSLIALVLCISMLAGTTFAWFSDVVTSKSNIIQSGNLDITMEWANDFNATTWNDATMGAIFTHDNWEPGYTDVKYIKITNAGNLNLKWRLTLEAKGTVTKLSDVIGVYCVNPATGNLTSIDGLTPAGMLTNVLNNKDVFAPTGALARGEEVIVAIAMHMDEEAGNTYQGLSLCNAGFSVKLVATQNVGESDSFGDQYDNDAEWPEFKMDFEATYSLIGINPNHDGELENEVIIRHESGAYAVVPAGTKLAEGATELKFTGKNVEAGGNFADTARSYDIHISGIAEDNTTCITVFVGKILEPDLSATELKLYHESEQMTRVNSVSDFAINNQYTYDAETGAVTLYVNNFSVFSAVKATADVWDGTSDATWYNENDTEFTLTTAEQFAGFRDLVDAGTTFAGKTVKLATDIDLANKPFDPIGYNYESKGGQVFKGVFDGGNHTIYNLYQNCWELDPDKTNYSTYTYSTAGGGLFASIVNATIKNLAVSGAEIVFECIDMGIVVGYAQGECHFENIIVTNSKIANYNRYTGGVVGEVSEGVDANGDGFTHTFKNITVDSTVTVSGLWGSFGCGMGGVIGGKWGTATVLMENVISAPVMDVYNDVVSAYQWYAFRGCGMLIGHTEEPYSDGRHSGIATASFLTCENVKVYYGDWVNYHYYEFENQDNTTGQRYPWVRAEAGEYCDAFSNIRYGVPTHSGVKVSDLTEEELKAVATDYTPIIFNQLYGADRGMYGQAAHEGVTVIYKNTKTIYLENDLGWQNLKLHYWYKNGDDTWTNLDEAGITLTENNGVYRVELPAYADEFKITADGENATRDFYVSEVIDGVVYDLNGEHTHEYQWVIDVEPTLDHAGVKHEECAGCPEKRNENTPIAQLVCANHVITKVDAKAATCLEKGNAEYYTCDACGKVYFDAAGESETYVETFELPALGHNLVNGKCTGCDVDLNRTITLMNGNTVSATVSGIVGEKIILPNSDGIEGWYTDEGCTKRFTENTFSDNLTLYAKLAAPNTSGTITIKSYFGNNTGSYYDGKPLPEAIKDGGLADILCVQDAGDTYWINRTVDGYVSAPQNKLSADYLIYYKNTFTRVDDGLDYLIEGCCSFIVLQRGGTGPKFAVVNAWFKDADVLAKVQSTITTIQDEHGPIPVIIAGFSGTGTKDSSNATIDSSVCEGLTTNAQFFDAFQIKKQSTSLPQENSTYYYNYERSHIFVSYQMQYAVECYDGLATSRNTSHPIVAKITLPACNHNLTLKSETPATCSTAGIKAHYACSTCGKLFADEFAMIEITEADIRIPAFGHSYGESVVIAPTCESNGYTAQTCSVCGYVYTDNETPALGHAWTNACDTDCNNACGATRDKVHDYQWVVDKVPTAESVGVKHEECTVCQQQRNKNTPIDMLNCGHELTKVEAVAPTCTTAGNREYYTCSVCDRAYTDASGLIETTVTRCTIAAFGHKNNPSGVCTVCGQVKITFQNGSANNTLDIVPAVLGIAGEAMSTLPTPELAGYTFEGWYRDKACTVLFAETIFSESLTLYAKFVPVTTGEEQTLTLVSLNINDGDSTNSFITSLVNSNNKPDIISLQEAGSSWRKLGNNAVFSNYYGAYQNTQGGNVIFINTKTLTYVTSTARWISDTYTDEFGNTYSTNASRYVHYFVVRRLSDDQLFAIINIQLDNDGKNSYEIAEKIRQEEIEFLMRQVEGIWGGKDRGTMPIIITGDFNSTSDGIAYDRMTETYGFFDSSLVANQIISNNATTGDFIFVSSHLQYLIDSYNVETNSGSDHNAIILEFTLPKICSHNFRDSKTEAVAATCTTAGNKEYYTCATCGKVYADIRATVETTVEDCFIPALGHNWVDATCESPKNCSNCGTTEGEALGHAWTNTCDTDCNNSCGATREITHDYQWVVDKAPTVASEGVKHEECTVCQEKQNENTPIDKLLCTHNGTIAKVEAIATTCKAAGNKQYYACSACNKTYSDANGYLEITEEDYTIPALPHTWVDATCVAPKTCSACGATEGDVSTEHVINAEGTCTVCNQVQIGTINLYGGQLPYGTYSGDNAKIATAVSGLDGEKITLPNPQLKGHTFDGWYNDYACTEAFKGETFVKGSKLTLYAKWTPNTESIKVMSFNVRTDWYKGSRDERVVATIQDNMPDVLCVQEADSGWMSILNDRLPDLGYTAVYANKWGRDGENSGEHTAIFFKTDKFTAVASGTKWLSNTPDKVSKYSYTDANGTTHTANYNRIMTYVVLERKSDGGCFLVVNTHLDNNGDNAHEVAEVIRQAEVDIMMKIIKSITDARGDIPVIVTGDFNVIPNNRTAYTAMTSTYGFSDSSQVAKQSEKGEATYNGMGEGTASILDYIFVSRHMKETVTSYNVCDAKRDGEWISDHNAIISVIEMPYVKRK